MAEAANPPAVDELRCYRCEEPTAFVESQSVGRNVLRRSCRHCLAIWAGLRGAGNYRQQIENLSDAARAAWYRAEKRRRGVPEPAPAPADPGGEMA